MAKSRFPKRNKSKFPKRKLKPNEARPDEQGIDPGQVGSGSGGQSGDRVFR